MQCNPSDLSYMNTDVPVIEHPVLPPAKAAANLLNNRGLDGRDLNANGTDLRSFNPLKAISPLLRLPFSLLMLPVCLYALGGQIIMGRLLGDSTDEGLDARTSYHFLAAMFGSLMFWPILSAFAVWGACYNAEALHDLIGFDWTIAFGTGNLSQALAIIGLGLSILPVFWLSGRVVSKFWDDLCDLKRMIARLTVRGAQRQNIRGALATLNSEMKKMNL